MDPELPDHSEDKPSLEDVQRRLTNAAVSHSRLNVNELWLYYFSIGGSAGEYEIEAFLSASYSLPLVERDLLAHAANEMIERIPPAPRAPYSSDLHNQDRKGDSLDGKYSEHPDGDAKR